MTTKAGAANGGNERDEKYRSLVDDCLREFKEIRKQIRRDRVKTQRLGASSRKTLADTWETLRRVEATL